MHSIGKFGRFRSCAKCFDGVELFHFCFMVCWGAFDIIPWTCISCFRVCSECRSWQFLPNQASYQIWSGRCSALKYYERVSIMWSISWCFGRWCAMIKYEWTKPFVGSNLVFIWRELTVISISRCHVDFRSCSNNEMNPTKVTTS